MASRTLHSATEATGYTRESKSRGCLHFSAPSVLRMHAQEGSAGIKDEGKRMMENERCVDGCRMQDKGKQLGTWP